MFNLKYLCLCGDGGQIATKPTKVIGCQAAEICSSVTYYLLELAKLNLQGKENN